MMIMGVGCGCWRCREGMRLCRLWCHADQCRLAGGRSGTPSTPRTATHTINIKALGASTFYPETFGKTNQALSYSNYRHTWKTSRLVSSPNACTIAARDLYERTIRLSPKGNSVDDMVVYCIRRCLDDLAALIFVPWAGFFTSESKEQDGMCRIFGKRSFQIEKSF
jgi:hypothetical protein